MTRPEDDSVTVAEAAALLHVTVGAIYKAIKAGRIDAIRPAVGPVRIPRSALTPRTTEPGE